MADSNPLTIATPTARALNVLGPKWTLLVLAELGTGAVSFTEVKVRVAGISNELTRVRLNALVDAGLAQRTRFRQVPPRADYELTDLGRAALPIVVALADFGELLPDEPGEIEVDGALERLAELRRIAA